MHEKITEEKVLEYVADLAKIELNNEQKKLFLKQFNDILSYFKKLNELDTETVSPTPHILHSVNKFHEDICKPSLPQKEVINLSRHIQNGYFKVPKTL